MAPNYSSLHQQLTAAIAGVAPKGVSAASKAFIEAFYAQATIDHLKSLTPKRAASIALDCEPFYAKRGKGGPKISIKPVTITEDGRRLSRTQVMVLNDDMPFLVDSLSALFSSLGLTIHLLFHPILPTARDSKGERVALAKGSRKALHPESLIYLELSPLPAALETETLREKCCMYYRMSPWALRIGRPCANAPKSSRRSSPAPLPAQAMKWSSKRAICCYGLPIITLYSWALQTSE